MECFCRVPALAWLAPGAPRPPCIAFHEPRPFGLDRTRHRTVVGVTHVAAIGDVYLDAETLRLPRDGAAILRAPGLRAREDDSQATAFFEAAEVPAVRAA